ncbi:response regulator transcription factor [Nocardiopsis sp. JB363]|uniref:response regulator transcription factor n=1 Tax=Nocardiopsis sp. JB363 TaxID=1434837 RepID=UPI00097A707D|nr:response regulator transcription factor [Nocardiopsis sp. JB363]SIO84232.1 two-component system response regulator [Nocardiopsis sp. JB363]
MIRVAAQGHTVMSPEATQRLIVSARTDRKHRLDRATLVSTLTDREVQVLTCLGEGLTNGQIARRFFLTEATVKGHVSRLLEKLGCGNRTQAGLLAYEAGLDRNR